MKILIFGLLPLLASCGVNAGEQSVRSERAQTRLTKALEGKVAGAPQRCLPRFSRNDQRIIDRNTILYANGRTVYRNDPIGGCGGLDPGRTIVTTSIGGSGELCQGDIIRVVDQVSGGIVGSCAFSDFIPYRTPDAPSPRGS